MTRPATTGARTYRARGNVTALRYQPDGANLHEVVEFCDGRTRYALGGGSPVVALRAVDGDWWDVQPGYWVVRERGGRLRVRSDASFRREYEPAETPAGGAT